MAATIPPPGSRVRIDAPSPRGGASVVTARITSLRPDMSWDRDGTTVVLKVDEVKVYGDSSVVEEHETEPLISLAAMRPFSVTMEAKYDEGVEEVFTSCSGGIVATRRAPDMLHHVEITMRCAESDITLDLPRAVVAPRGFCSPPSPLYDFPDGTIRSDAVHDYRDPLDSLPAASLPPGRTHENYDFSAGADAPDVGVTDANGRTRVLRNGEWVDISDDPTLQVADVAASQEELEQACADRGHHRWDWLDDECTEGVCGDCGAVYRRDDPLDLKRDTLLARTNKFELFYETFEGLLHDAR